MSNYNEACTEVSTILSFLNREEYNKIPSNIIEIIEKNKNNEYIFEFDENVELKQQKLLEETRAILYNLFRDYLSTSEQKEKIIRMQKEERYKLNERKKLEYNVNDIFKRTASNKAVEEQINSNQEITALTEIKKENFIIKIINKIKKFLKKI